jgi:energy-coupling factor transport system permease protein
MLKTLNPLVKLAVCFVWLAAVVLIFDPRLELAAILLCALALILLDRVPPLLLLLLAIPFALFGFGFLTTSLLFRQESDFAVFLSGKSLISSPAFSAGLTLFLRAIACGMISMLFVLTTDPGAFVRALMRDLRLPPRVGYALFAVLQLVPDLAAEARQIRLARAMKRGRPPRRFPGPAESAGLVIPLLAIAIRRAGRTAIALEARGLRRGRDRTIIHVPPFRPRDAVFALAACALLAASITAVPALPPA